MRMRSETFKHSNNTDPRRPIHEPRPPAYVIPAQAGIQKCRQLPAHTSFPPTPESRKRAVRQRAVLYEPRAQSERSPAERVRRAGFTPPLIRAATVRERSFLQFKFVRFSAPRPLLSEPRPSGSGPLRAASAKRAVPRGAHATPTRDRLRTTWRLPSFRPTPESRRVAHRFSGGRLDS